jgi:hypothetical protein
LIVAFKKNRFAIKRQVECSHKPAFALVLADADFELAQLDNI